LIFALLISLCVQSFALSGTAPKEEVVYVNLSKGGSVDAIHVVNSFELDQDGRIIDYGDYTAFREMTSSGKLKLEKETVTIDAKAGKLYYEGTLRKNSIPWLFDIRYFLNGKELSGDETAGKNGALEIKMSIRQNPKTGDAFFRHYTLQVMFKLDTSACKNIIAKGATIANAGKYKQIAFTILPGRTADISLKSDVIDFEMPGISISGIPMEMDMEFENDPAMISKLRDLKDGVIKLDDGANELRDGAEELSEGSGDLKTGVSDLKTGVLELADGTIKLSDGIEELAEGVRKTDDGTAKLSEATEELTNGTKEMNKGAKKLLSGSEEIYNGIKAIDSGLSQLTSQNGSLTEGAGEIFDSVLEAANAELTALIPGVMELTRGNFEQVIDGILEQAGGAALQEAMEQARNDITSQVTAAVLIQIRSENPEASEEEIAGIMSSETVQSQITMAVTQQLSAAQEEILEAVQAGLAADSDYIALLTLKGKLRGIQDFYNGLKAYTDGVSSIAGGASILTSGMRDWQGGMRELRDGMIELRDGTVELHDGVLELKDGTSKLLEGTLELKKGSLELNDGMVELKDGVVKLLDGAIELHEGIVEFHDGTVTMAEGTLKFRDKTSNIEEDLKDIVKKKIDEMLGRNFKTTSFVSDKNTNVLSVQFVMQTESISIPEVEPDPAEPDEAMTFFQRLLALFGF